MAATLFEYISIKKDWRDLQHKAIKGLERRTLKTTTFILPIMQLIRITRNLCLIQVNII